MLLNTTQTVPPLCFYLGSFWLKLPLLFPLGSRSLPFWSSAPQAEGWRPLLPLPPTGMANTDFLLENTVSGRQRLCVKFLPA